MTGKGVLWTIIGLGSLAVLGYLFFTGTVSNPLRFSPEPQEDQKVARQLTVTLHPQDESGMRAESVIKETEDGSMFVDIRIMETPQTQNIAHPARINFGTCAEPGGEIYLLGVVNGYSDSKLLRLSDFSALFADAPLNINLRASQRNIQTVVACGDIHPEDLEVLE